MFMILNINNNKFKVKTLHTSKDKSEGMMNKNFDKIDYYKKKHIQKCIKWCEKFDIKYHKNISFGIKILK